MAINTSNVSLRISAGFPSQFPRDPLPQIAFSGRSNVGKSSLINTLLGRKSLARVSASPGKTVTVNFYDVDRALFLVDLPGYGYARRALEDKKKWSALTDGYFSNNPNIDLLKLVVQLIDVRVGPTEDDKMMLSYLSETDIPFIIVLTKCDKLSKTALEKDSAKIKDACLSITKKSDLTVIPFSSVTREGKDKLFAEICRAASVR